MDPYESVEQIIGKPMHVRISKSAFIFIALILSNAGICDQFNQRNLLPGGRASTMGGAFTAISDDASGGWYNPAGLAFVQNSDVSLSANAFTKSSHSIKGALGERDVAESSASLYPAFAGGTSKLGPFHVGYSYFTTDRENSDESFVYDVSATETTSAFTYHRKQLVVGEKVFAGASIALPIGNNLSLGVSEFYYRRTMQMSQIESTVYNSGATFDASLRQSTLNEGSMTVIGLLLKGAGFSMGLATKIPKALADNTTIETAETIYVGSAPDRSTDITKPHNFDEVTPHEYSIGLAWQPSPAFAIAVDAIHLPGEKSLHHGDGGVDTKATNNFSIGGELFLGHLGIRGGGFTNNSLVSNPDPGLSGQPGSINYIGWSSGLAYRSKSFESMIGIVRQIGSGKDQTVSGLKTVYDIEAESTSYLLTSRYSL